MGHPDIVVSNLTCHLQRDPAKLEAQEKDVTNRDKLIAELTHKVDFLLLSGSFKAEQNSHPILCST